MPYDAPNRNYSNFQLADNPLELAGGIVGELAELTEVELVDKGAVISTMEDVTFVDGQLRTLVGAVGASRELKENEQGAKELFEGSDQERLERAAGLVDRSGILDPLGRSLWLHDSELHPGAALVMSGGVKRWMDRAANSVLETIDSQDDVYVFTGSREMKPEEDPDDDEYQQLFTSATHPTETDYARELLAPRLIGADVSVVHRHYEENSGKKLPALFFQDEQHLVAGKRQIVAVHAAGAGIQFAAQLRTGAREVNPDFDHFPSNPDLYILTDTIEVATTIEQAKQPDLYQNPFRALRNIAVAAKSLNLARGQDLFG